MNLALIQVLLCFITAMICYGYGEYFSKIYVTSQNSIYMLYASLLYIGTFLFWFPCIKYVEQLTIIGNIWNVSYIIITLIVGFFVFKETVSSIQMAGIIMGLISIFMVIFG